MQLVRNLNDEQMHAEACSGLFTSSLKACRDDDSTSAGSSERGSSPAESPCSPIREPTRSPKSRQAPTSFPAVPPGCFHVPPPVVPPPGLAPPPGLVAPPPGLEDVWGELKAMLEAAGAPPGLDHVDYTPKTFRKELTAIFKELASNRNVAAAVRRVRVQSVPLNRQAAEYTDIITRAAEEHRGICRRLYFAFATGLSAGAWDQDKCLSGLRTFFEDVFDDLCEELPRLPTMVRTELVPTLRSVIPEERLREVVPATLIES